MIKKTIVKKKKTSKQKIEELLDVASEELLQKDDDLPFNEGEETNIIRITPQEITNELNIRPKTEITTTIPENTEENDFEFARTTLYKLIQKASIVTDGIIGLCDEAGHPRMYEVAGQLIKVTSEVTKDFISLRKTKAELNKIKVPGDVLPDMTKLSNGGGDTYVLQGTTAEILDAIRKSKEPKNE